MAASVDFLEESLGITVAWLDALGREMGASRSAAYDALAAVLHGLRDNVTAAEGAEFAGALPIVVKGIFYEDWGPSRVPGRDGGSAAFIERVRIDAGLRDDARAALAVERVARLLRREIDGALLDRTLASLPPDVRVAFGD